MFSSRFLVLQLKISILGKNCHHCHHHFHHPLYHHHPHGCEYSQPSPYPQTDTNQQRLVSDCMSIGISLPPISLYHALKHKCPVFCMFDFAKSLAKCPILPFFLPSFHQHLLSAYYVPVLNDVGDKREKKKLWPLTLARPPGLVSSCYILGCPLLYVLGAGGFEKAEILDHEDIDYVSQICLRLWEQRTF